MLVLGSPKDTLYDDVYEKLSQEAYCEDSTMISFVNDWLKTNIFNCLSDDFIELGDGAGEKWDERKRGDRQTLYFSEAFIFIK